MQPVKFMNISRAQFEAVRRRIEIQAEKVILAGDSGGASGEGFEVIWTYSEADATLEMQCLEKPWYVTKSSVIAKMRELVEVDLD